MSDTAAPLEYKQIADGFAVAGQLRPEQMASVADAGFTALICNRPDGEAPQEPQYAAISAAAEAAGLAIRYIPVSNQTGLTMDNVEAMRAALAELDGPILAYCRSGARSANLYGAATG